MTEAQDVEDVGVERLLKLLWTFRHSGGTRTTRDIEGCGYPDISNEASAGRRNFYNDRQRLAAMGMMLEEQPKGVWKVTSNPADINLELSPDERDALTTARLLVADDDAAASPTIVGHLPTSLPQLMTALSDGHPVRFTYADRERFVDPVSVVVNNSDRWFLQGIDRNIFDSNIFDSGTLGSGTVDSGTLGSGTVGSGTPPDPARTYRIERITGVVIERAHNIRPVPNGAVWSLHPSGWRTDPPVDAVVRFPHPPLPEWLAILGGPADTSSEPDDDGTVCATFTVVNHSAFVRRVLAIGARVVEPASLRDRAGAELAAHLESFGAA